MRVKIDKEITGATVQLTAEERTQLLFEIRALFPRLNGGTTIGLLYAVLRED